MRSNKEVISDLKRSGMGRELSDSENRQLRDILVKCYLDIAKVCDKFGLQIMLGGGSCLGAVRHEGFIPWDDDFDVNMPRKDFERLKEIFNDELGDLYVLNCPNYSEKPTNRLAKILVKNTKFIELGMEDDDKAGMIKIDVFTAENIPDNQITRRLKGTMCNLIMLIAGCVHYANWYKRDNNNWIFKGDRVSSVRILIGKFFSFRPSRYWFDLVDKVVQYNKSSQCICFPTGRKHYFGEIHNRSEIFPRSKGIFEGNQVYLPNDVKSYLTTLYGTDYMQLPPEEKREGHLVLEISFPRVD